MKPLHSACVAAVLALATATAARAQQTRLEVTTPETPACAATGVQRVAVMVPPGRTREEISQAAAEGGMFPAGTQVVVLNLGEYTPLQNQQEFNRRMDGVLRTLLLEGYQIDGTLSVLLTVDESGTVTDARPATRNDHVDRVFRNLWKQAHFAPYAIGGCRMKAWISMPITMRSDWDVNERRVEMRTGTPPPPAP